MITGPEDFIKALPQLRMPEGAVMSIRVFGSSEFIFSASVWNALLDSASRGDNAALQRGVPMPKLITAERYHDFSAGHRVAGHESKCALLHGHNYRVYFTVAADALDAVGRVMDFSVIKTKLCQWLEDHWDHRFLAWEHDPVMRGVDQSLFALRNKDEDCDRAVSSIVWVEFNPTAENMAQYLLDIIGPYQLSGTGVRLIRVRIDETRKCSAVAEASS